MMKQLFVAALIAGCLVSSARADELVKSGPDLTAFSKVVHKLVVSQVPKEVYDDSGWGQTMAMPPKLSLPRLRQVVKIGDRLELPHGLWRKVKLTMTDPAKDLAIKVVEFKPTDKKTYRVVVEVEAAVHGWTETQHWQKGLQLVGFIADADAVVTIVLECDVAVSLDGKQFPPTVKVEPTVTNLKIELKDFTPQQLTLRRLGTVILEGQQARDVGEQVKGYLNDGLRAYEPQIRSSVNQAIAQSIRDGKGQLSATELLKALSGK